MTTAKTRGYVRCSVEGCRKKAIVQGKCKDHAEQKNLSDGGEISVEAKPAALADAKKKAARASAELAKFNERDNTAQEELTSGKDEVKGLEKDTRNNTSSGSRSSGLESLSFRIGMTAGKIRRLFDK